MKALILQTLKSFATLIVSIAFAVTILTIPLKLVYVWACFLWNLIG